MRTYDGTTVLDLPYQARQLIVVADDALVEASQREEEEALRRQEVGLGWVELDTKGRWPTRAPGTNQPRDGIRWARDRPLRRI